MKRGEEILVQQMSQGEGSRGTRDTAGEGDSVHVGKHRAIPAVGPWLPMLVPAYANGDSEGKHQ